MKIQPPAFPGPGRCSWLSGRSRLPPWLRGRSLEHYGWEELEAVPMCPCSFWCTPGGKGLRGGWDAGCPGGDVSGQLVREHAWVSSSLSKSSQRACGNGAGYGGSARRRPAYRFSALELHLTVMQRRGLPPGREVRGQGGCPGSAQTPTHPSHSAVGSPGVP